MHDPMVVAFEIPRPWREPPSRFFPKGYRPTVATIWHVDPEADGTDDSCRWHTPRATDADRKLVDEMVHWEQTRPYYFASPQRQDAKYGLWSIGPGDALALVLAVWQVAAWRLERRELTPRLALKAMAVAVSEGDNFQQSLAASTVEDQRRALLFIVLAYRRARRPWWRHPRWHIHHWRIQIHFVNQLKRWLFSRCAGCGRRFTWGYSPTTTNWHSKGPRWFRNESHVYHSECCPGTKETRGKPLSGTRTAPNSPDGGEGAR